MSILNIKNRPSARLSAALTTALLALAVTGCSGSKGPKAVATASTVAPAAVDPGWAGRDGVKEAIALLNRGEAVEARKRLVAVLKVQPGDGIARSLLSQIDTDPKVLLGAESYSYTVREGESLSSLAQRFLGDPMKFYALARYNEIAAPAQVGPGRTILIPGKRPAAVAKKASPPKPAPAAKKAPQTATAKAPPPAAKPPARTANPALAAKLRGQGLGAMNAGSINRAVALLRQALSLDPANPVIRADLGRALRIQKTVVAR